MKTQTISVLGLACLLASSIALPAAGADNSAKTSRPQIYEEHANGAKLIADALATAKKQNKRVLLQFGANWCGWCHKLHDLFQTDPQISARIKESYVVVMLDVNKEHNSEIDKQYGNPTQFGLPVLVVLDANGKALFTEDTNKLESGDHHDPKKVLGFLNQWAGTK